MKQKDSSIARFNKGELLYRINWDAIDFCCDLLSISTTLVIFTVTISYTLYKMVSLHFQYGTICFLLSALSIGIPFCFKKLRTKLKDQLKEAEGQVFALENSLIVNRNFIYVHKISVRTAKRVYERLLSVFKKVTSRYILVINTAEFTAEVFKYASQAAVFLYGSYLVYQKEITPGTIVFSLGVANITQEKFRQVFSMIQEIWDLKIVHKRLNELLGNPEAILGKETKPIKSLSVKNLSFSYAE